MNAILEGHLNLLIGRNREIMEKRVAVCSPCVFLSVTGSCIKCGCGVRAKASVLQEKCKIGKW